MTLRVTSSLALVAAFAGAAVAGPAPARADFSGWLADNPTLVRWLLARDPDLAAARARIEQSGAALAQSGVFQNPQLDLSLGNLPVSATNPPGLDFAHYSIFSIGLTQTLELGKRGPRMAAGRLRVASSHEAFADTLEQKVSAARAALGKVLYLKQRQAILDESLAAARTMEEVEKSRLDHLDLSGIDYDRLQLDTTSLDSDVERNRSEYEAALSACQAALLAPCDPEGAAPDDLDRAAPVPAAPVADGLARRPDVLALADERAATVEDARLAHNRRIPDLSIRLGYTRDTFTVSGDNPHTLMLSLSMPLPVFDTGRHDAARAEQRVLELGHQQDALVNAGRADVMGLERRRQFLIHTIQTLTQQAVPKSAGVLDATEKAFNHGGVSMTDLLLARRTHISLLLTLMDLRFDHFNARNDLRRVLGLDAMEQP